MTDPTGNALLARIKELEEALNKIANGYIGDQTAEQQFIWAVKTARKVLGFPDDLG